MTETALLLGDFDIGQSLWSIREGFHLNGWKTVYLPTRACIATRRQLDIDLAREESELIPDPSTWRFKYDDDQQFERDLVRTIERHRPRILLWWCSKNDRPPGLIERLRDRFPGCRTVSHSQDDPWNALRSPEFTDGFQFVSTCCAESVDVYARRGIEAIVLYPPPAASLHLAAAANPLEACDFSVTMFSIYARRDDRQADRDDADADGTAKVTHYIGFPDQRALRHEVVDALRGLGTTHIYGGLGYGTFPGFPRAAYRGFRRYRELPGIYRAAKVNINHHNSPRSRGYLNQRDTAITGSGGFMLTDHVEGIEEIFDVGREIDTWHTLDELRDKAAWWLAHDRERKRAAARAQQRVFSAYGNAAFARKLAAFVEPA